MNPLAILGAVIGAAIGAGIWGAITHFTGYEIGYVAWAVGGLAGGGAVMLGGQGKTLGVLVAAIALLGMLGGKAVATHLSLKGDIAEVFYEEIRNDAAAFAAVDDEDGFRRFMVDHGYTEASTVGGISEEDLQYFLEARVPMLERLHKEQLSQEDWADAGESQEFFADIASSVNYLDIVSANMGLLDIVFGFLGVSTAFSMVRRVRAPDEVAEQEE